MDAIGSAIEQINTGGATNLNSGLMLGYKQAEKHFDSERSNRVILLTDGRANLGTTDPSEITKGSREFNKQGIELSTIGLGNDFNQELLRDLADAGRGAVHFVDKAEDIQKVFVDDFDSLLSNAARKLKVEIDFGDEDVVRKIYGYETKNDDSEYTFKPDNMGHGATQVILAEMKESNIDDEIKVKLTYHDCILDEKVTKTLSIDIDDVDDFSEDKSLRKNFVIGKVANSLKRSAELCNDEKYDKSTKELRKSIKFAREYFEDGDDEDVDRIVELADKQRQRLRRAERSEDNDRRSERR